MVIVLVVEYVGIICVPTHNQHTSLPNNVLVIKNVIGRKYVIAYPDLANVLHHSKVISLH